METEKTEENIFQEIQNIRYPQRNKNPENPKQSPEERAIITNLQKIEALNKQARIIQDKIHENPLDFMSAVVWEVQLEKLAFDEKKLLKRNEKLWKAIGKQLPEQQQHYPKINIVNSPKINPNIGYKPINLSALVHQNKNLELQKTEEQLETVYDQKNLLFQQIQNSPTGIANTELNHELDKVIQLEAKLISKAEELRLSIESKLYNKIEKPKEEKEHQKAENTSKEQDSNNDKSEKHSLDDNQKIEDDKFIESTEQSIENEYEIFEFEQTDMDELEFDTEQEMLNEIEDIREVLDNDLDRDNEMDKDY